MIVSPIRARTITALTLLLATAGPAAGATFYVRTSGNDSNSGNTPSSAFATIGKAASVASAGDVVYVGGGTYTGASTVSCNGTANAPVRFIADTTGAQTGSAGTVTLTFWSGSVLSIRGDYVAFDGFVISGGATGVEFFGATGSSLVGCTIQSWSSTGISFKNATSISITSSTVQSGGGVGMDLTNSSTGSSVTVDQCLITGVGSDCINVWHTNAILTLRRTRLTNSSGWGVRVQRGTAIISNLLATSLGGGVYAESHSSVNVQLWHATMSGLGASGVRQDGGSLTFRNSVVTSSGGGIQKSGGTTTHGNNAYNGLSWAYSGLTAGSNDLPFPTNPQFVSPGTDWRLQASSPLRNAGVDASSVTTFDMNGTYRPCNGGWDIGAYQNGSCIPPPSVLRWTEVDPR
ncbi:MAG: right-handed parallel beta-helix repeat-containing protein [Phycisphaerales bacterium]|nr:right-handed parallel beta-helix repeat-containing protein [Phycisphaerales bacterium]